MASACGALAGSLRVTQIIQTFTTCNIKKGKKGRKRRRRKGGGEERGEGKKKEGRTCNKKNVNMEI